MHVLEGEWLSLFERVATVIEGLAEGEKLRVGEPEPPTRPMGLLRQRRTPVPATRYVQFVGGTGVLTAECVGSTSFGGTWEMTKDVEMTLQRQGWGWPFRGTTPHFRRTALPGESEWLVQDALLALEVLGADPTAMEVTRPTPVASGSRR